MNKKKKYYVYLATNKINGKHYVGQTVDFRSRVWQHMRCYEKEDCKFHDAIKEYGVENFDFEILETVYSREESLLLEREYIEKYNSYRDGYNMNKGGVGGHNAKAIVKLTLDGKFVKRYDSACDTIIDGFHDATILLNCKGKLKSSKGYMFMFEEDYIAKGAKKYIKPQGKLTPVIQCDLEGNMIAEFKSVKEAAQKTGIGRTRISSALNGSTKTANGFIWILKSNYPIKNLKDYKSRKKGRKVAQIDKISGDIIAVFDRMTDAAKTVGGTHKGIFKAIDKPTRSAFGYRWKSIKTEAEYEG